MVQTWPKFYIPDTLAKWPWPRHLNPHYEEAKKESQEWASSFKAFNPKAQHAFNRCDFSKSALMDLIIGHC